MSKVLNASASHPYQGKAPNVTRGSKQTDDADPMVTEFQASTENDGYTEPKYTTPGVWKNKTADSSGPPVDANNESDFAPNAGDPDDEDVDMEITREEEEEREKLLRQGADMRQRRGFNRFRTLPPKATDIIVKASFAFRAAWGSGKHPKLLTVIREANEELSQLEIPEHMIEEFQSSSNYQGKRSNPRDDYVASLLLQETFMDTIITLSKSVNSYYQARSGKKKDKMLVNLVVALLGTQPAIWDMGMTWKLVTPHWLVDDLEKLFTDGLHILKNDSDLQDVEMAGNIQAWLTGKHDTEPTVAQLDPAISAPQLIKNCFDDIAKGKNPDAHIESLEFIEQDIVSSNKRLGFQPSDHTDLGTDRLKKSWHTVQDTMDETERKKMCKRQMFLFCLHLYNQGWICLLDEVPDMLDDANRNKMIMLGKAEQSYIGKGLIDKEVDERKRIEWGIGGRPMDGAADFQQSSVPLSEPALDEDDDAIWNDVAQDHAKEAGANRTTSAFFTNKQNPNSNSNAKPPFPQFSNPFSNSGEEKGKTNGSAFQFGAGGNDATAPGGPFATKPPNFFGPSTPKPFTSATKTSSGDGPSVATGAPPAFKNCRMPGPVGADSQKTELGWIVGGRKFGGQSSRHVVNVGTDKNPVFKVIDGPTFGRGLGPSLVEKYPLPTPQIPYDSTKRLASDIKQVCHVAVSAPCANSDRRPVTYYCIKWKSETQDYWMSRSELISFVGKAWLDRKDRSSNMPSRHDQMENAMENNLQCLQHFKTNKIHPDTGKPLLESDRNETPWLFPTSY
jgi:hypothetical protein